MLDPVAAPARKPSADVVGLDSAVPHGDGVLVGGSSGEIVRIA
jgi:hypothetical protein